MNLQEEKQNEISIGILGAGIAASMHCKALDAISIDISKYVFDIDEDRAKNFAFEHKCQYIKDIDCLLQNVGSVIIATPERTHFELVNKALKANKNVLCEKPMASSVKEACDMFKLSKTVETVCTIGFNYRFFEIINVLREIDFYSIKKISLSLYRLYRDDWKRNETRVLLDLGIHLIDLLRFIKRKEIMSDNCIINMRGTNGFDYESDVTGLFSDGSAFSIKVGRTDDVSRIGFLLEVSNDEEKLLYDSSSVNSYILCKNGLSKKFDMKDNSNRDFFDFTESIIRQDKEWLDSIICNRTGVEALFEDGYKSQLLVDYFYKMAHWKG